MVRQSFFIIPRLSRRKKLFSDPGSLPARTHRDDLLILLPIIQLLLRFPFLKGIGGKISDAFLQGKIILSHFLRLRFQAGDFRTDRLVSRMLFPRKQIQPSRKKQHADEY